MNRRKFLIGSGAFITVASLSYYGFSEYERIAEDKIKRPNPKDFEDPILKAIAYGASASNPHNTQAWKFKITNQLEMFLFVDPNRILPETDPPTRQIHIGCGCFLETASIGMIEEGYSTKIDYFPNGEYNIEKIGEFPVARLTLVKDDNVKRSPLNDVLLDRRTSRLKFSQEIIDNEKWNNISSLFGDTHSTIQLITDSETLEKIRPLLSEGMKVESYTYRTYDESRIWFRENEDKIASERDGINLPGNGVAGVSKIFAEMQLKNLTEKAWHDKKSINYTLDSHNEKVLSSPNIITIKTGSNTLLDWVKAGQDYCRLQLACLVHEFYTHPLSQVLQEFEEMKVLRSKFEKEMGLKNQEKIQMALRAGKSKKPYLSYRRELNDFVM